MLLNGIWNMRKAAIIFYIRLCSAKDLKYEEMQEALKIEAYYDNEGTAEPELKLHCMQLYCFRIRNPALQENTFGSSS